MQIFCEKSKFFNGAFDQNTYVLTNENEAVIVDAGAELEDVERNLNGKKVLAVLLTHLHFDHTFNIEKYITKFGCDVYISNQADDVFEDTIKNASSFFGKNITHKIPKSAIKYYAKKLKLGSFEFEVYQTPGHSQDSVCLLCENLLFCGDLFFFDGVGRTDLFGGSAKQLTESLRLILKLNFDTVYPGHSRLFSKAHAERNLKYYLISQDY